MAAFLSHNNVKPYTTLADQKITDSVEIYSVSGSEIEEVSEFIYVIFTENLYNNIEIKVENENSSGTSLYISALDGVGNPVHWGKLITLTNIDAREQDVKVLIKYKWQVINNIYILKRLNVSGNINIYEV